MVVNVEFTATKAESLKGDRSEECWRGGWVMEGKESRIYTFLDRRLLWSHW